jgi:Putative transposase of IS4/5 family (DUF4096)
MNCKYANLQKDEIEKLILPFIPVNKRGFPSRFNVADIFRCIVHKLKNGSQWKFLFVDLESVTFPFSWQTVYYYYRKWCKLGVFQHIFRAYVYLQKDKLNTEQLNLDGTHSLVKKTAENAAYQYRKKGRTSNILIMTDGRGIPIASGSIISGNHNDLYKVVPQYSSMINELRHLGIDTQNSIQMQIKALIVSHLEGQYKEGG